LNEREKWLLVGALVAVAVVAGLAYWYGYLRAREEFMTAEALRLAEKGIII